MDRIEQINARVPVIVQQVNGDLRVRGHSGNELRLEGDDVQLDQESPEAPIYVRSAGDCEIKLPAALDLTVEQVNGDAKITNLDATLTIGAVNGDLIVRHIQGNAKVERVGSDCVVKHLDSNVTINEVGSDLVAQQIDGDLAIGIVGSDLQIRDVAGSCTCEDIGSDLVVTIPFRAGKTYSLGAASSVTCIIPPDASATFYLPHHTDIEVNDTMFDVEIEESEDGQRIVLGNGAAEVHIHTTPDFALASKRDYQTRIDLEINLDQQLSDLEHQINENLSGLGELIETQTQQAIQQAANFARHFTGKHINHQSMRQVKSETERAKRQAARARRHTERMQRPTRRQQPSSAADWEPVSNEERMLILKMVEEGKITIEEAENLLSSLEGN